MIEIGIVETKNIIKAINDSFGIDFSDYALTSFKRRLERIIELFNFKYPDLLINKLHDDPSFIDLLVHEISIPSTEMFRDPSLWRLLRDELIPGIYNESGNSFKIWIPNSVSGDELFSLTILLKEMGLLDSIQIIVSSMSNNSIELIKSGIIPSSKIEISSDNYVRANGKYQLANYIEIRDNQYYRDTSLLKNVTFVKQDVNGEPLPQGIKLVLLRNKMIYFNQVLQWKTVKNIYQSMLQGGLLIVGIKETLSQFYGSSDFVLINENECIYKRK
jgi:chemotaxis protein methyltransferase CheR